MRWSHHEEETALQMKKDGATHGQIARELPGRTREQVERYFARRFNARDKKNPVAVEILRSQFGARPPVEVLFDQDRRINAPLTPNMIVLGDPVVPRWNSNAVTR
jgi:hypothetical protein